jgi:hypothetical protein
LDSTAENSDCTSEYSDVMADTSYTHMYVGPGRPYLRNLGRSTNVRCYVWPGARTTGAPRGQQIHTFMWGPGGTPGPPSSQAVSPGVPGVPGGPSPGGDTGPIPTSEPCSPWSPWRALMAEAREFASGAPGHGRDPATGPRGLEAQVLPYPGNPQIRPVKYRNR